MGEAANSLQRDSTSSTQTLGSLQQSRTKSDKGPKGVESKGAMDGYGWLSFAANHRVPSLPEGERHGDNAIGQIRKMRNEV